MAKAETPDALSCRDQTSMFAHAAGAVKQYHQAKATASSDSELRRELGHFAVRVSRENLLIPRL